MKKRLLILCVFIQFVNSQNLVPNGSFENYTECPQIQGDFEVDNWYNILNHSGTADFFHTCSSGIYTVPMSLFGNQNPKDGNAFGGMSCFNNLTFELREYMQVELINPLEENKFYKLSFFVSLGDNEQFALNHIGGALTQTAIEGNNTLDHLPIMPQVFAEDVITDKDNWIEISGVFQASGGESFLTIGVFSSDEEISTVSFPESENAVSYYFVDSVSIIETEESNLEENCLTILNPVYEYLHLNSSNSIESLDIILFDISGKRIKKKISGNEVYIGDLSEGVYIIHYKCGTESYYKKIIKT